MIIQSSGEVNAAFHLLGFVGTFLPLLVILMQFMSRFYTNDTINETSWKDRAFQAIVVAGVCVVAVGYTSADIIKLQASTGRL